MIRRAYTAQSQHIILCPEQTSFEVRPYDLGAQSIVCYSRRALGHGHTIAPHNRYTQYDARSRLRGTTIRFRRTINSMPGADELRGTAIRLRRTIVTHNIIPGADELSGTAIRFRRTINSMPGADELRGTAILLRRTILPHPSLPGADELRRTAILYWPLQDIRLLRGCCTGINHPFTPPPAHLHCPR